MISILKSIFGTRAPTSASVAKDRLQLIIMQERSGQSNTPDFLPDLQRELLDVIVKYVKVDPSAIKVEMDRSDTVDSLLINIALPDVSANAVAPEAATV